LCIFAHFGFRTSATHYRESTDDGASPEVSKAYYAELTGEPDVYVINAPLPFDLYVSILVPDILGQKKDVSAAIIKNGDTKNPLAVLEGINFEWKKFFEPFGHDTYWQGPEYKARAEAGTYEIRVWSSNNDSKYSLAIGEIEKFDAKEGMNALSIIPDLKRNFFEESPISFILSPFGWGLIVIMYILAFIVGFILKFIIRKFKKHPSTDSTSSPQAGSGRNIAKPDRLLRLAIGVGLLLWAITTSWSPILIFFSGFALFEAMFSWCGFYAVMGRNTCPVE
jgi:hypothetical protein